MRRALQLEVMGHRLVGTLHEPKGRPDLCVLLLSFGQQPRSWVGDLGAFSADRICEAGYPVYRFDMPGLGDTPGEVPVHLEVLWRWIQQGGHEQIAKNLVHELRRRFGYRGVVVGGFCGGAVSAVFSIDAWAGDAVGLMLLEPEMGLVPEREGIEGEKVDEVATVTAFVERLDRVKDRLRSPKAWLRLATGKSDLAFWRGMAEYAIKRAFSRAQGETLPPDANRKMIEAWQRIGRSRLPILVVSVGQPQRTKYYASYGFGPGLAPKGWQQTWIEVPNTTHAMVAGGAKEAVPRHLVQWLKANHPV